MSNNEVGKPSNLELTIETENTEGEHTPTSSILPAVLLCIANDITNSFAVMELNSGWIVFLLHYWTFLVRYWIFNPVMRRPGREKYSIDWIFLLPAIMRIAGLSGDAPMQTKKPRLRL